MECPRCSAYEQAVMSWRPEPDEPEGAGSEAMSGSAAPVPPPPCDHYTMSPAFLEWVVVRMRGEVVGQVAASGLDRLAIVKGPP